MKTDSVNKIKGYLESASMDLILSKMFFRSYSCPAKCGACCFKFSLDYFEGPRWEKFKELYPQQVKRFEKRTVDGVTVYTDAQQDNEDRFCRNLNKTTGRCKIHGSNPFTCEFELLRFVTHKDANKSYLMTRLYGRGWNMLRIDGKRGAMCEILPFKKEKFHRDIELLEELNEIGLRFKMKTKLSKVISYLKSLNL
jgi:Fe-S-cluster containining protein